MTGPSRAQLLMSLPRFLKDPLQQFVAWQKHYGDVVEVPVRTPPTLHLSHPDDIRHILVTNALNYRKTGALIIGKRLMGQGLLASDEPLHQHQRKIVQPHFVRQTVASFVDMMQEVTEKRVETWKSGTIIDIFPEMTRLTIAIIGRAYFTVDLSGEADQLYRDFGTCQKFMQKLVNIPVPRPLTFRYRNAVKRVDAIVNRIIDERMSSQESHDDLLATLLNAKDPEGRPVSRKQVRDEMVNILLAGHETTANALSWTWYFLALNPRVEQEFHAELSRIDEHDGSISENMNKLVFTGMVLNESMRLRPPVWILGRIAKDADVLPSGRRIPPGTEVLILPYIAHRNPDTFPEPEEFRPARFAASAPDRPPFVFFPFGGGPRGCIGEMFARTEALVILATIARRFSLRCVDGDVSPDPLVTLRPRKGIRMEIRARNRTTSRATAIHVPTQTSW